MVGGKRSGACKLKVAKTSHWSENTPSARNAVGRFSPLDEILELLPGQLAPGEQEKLIRLGGWLPFEPAAQLFTAFTGIAVSKSSCRRLTEKGGQVIVNDQEAAVQAMEAGELARPERVVEKLVLSTDGCMVPLVGGEWAEVRTLVIGEAGMGKTAAGELEASLHSLSYFSRLTDAVSFQRAALVETERRGVLQAQAVAAVTDGAEWIQQFVDYHRPDAVRILDFPHAAERFTTIYQACRDQAVELEVDWPAQRSHQLKEEGGKAVLASLRALQKAYPQVVLDEPLTYLDKREKMLAYPQFMADGWPIGSGAVESANKLVVQVRLKGPGMHWHRAQVNPMLALRNVICNDRWQESWPSISKGLRQKQHLPLPPEPESPQPTPNLVAAYFIEMQRHHLAWEQLQLEASRAKPKKPWKPAPNHPWRRYSSSHPQSAKK